MSCCPHFVSFTMPYIAALLFLCSELILRPYGWTAKPCPDEAQLSLLGDKMREAAESVRNCGYLRSPPYLDALSLHPYLPVAPPYGNGRMVTLPYQLHCLTDLDPSARPIVRACRCMASGTLLSLVPICKWSSGCAFKLDPCVPAPAGPLPPPP